MDLVAALYASSSDSDDDPAPAANPAATLASTPQRSVGLTWDQEREARAAIARRFALRAQEAKSLASRGTAQERVYGFKPYTSRRAPDVGRDSERTRVEVVADDPLRAPLYPTLARAAWTSVPGRVDRPGSLPQLQTSVGFDGHTGAINDVDWNAQYPPLFLSASMDRSVRVWSLPRRYYDNEQQSQAADSSSRCRRVLLHHTKGVKSAKWAVEGQHMWSGGFDGLAAYTDVERAKIVQQYTDTEHITAACPHPTDPQLALFSTNRGRILQWDLRMEPSSTAAVYNTKNTSEILDLLFLPNDEAGGDVRFVSSSALSARETSHHTLAVWDFRSSAPIANILHNGQPCAFPRLRLHPDGRHFVGQSTSSEAVLFSARAPYKQLKDKHSFHSAHDVQGYSVGCSFNATGALFATGDKFGRVVLYCSNTQKVRTHHQIFATTTPCLTAEFHPRWPSMLIAGGNDGHLHLLDAYSTNETI